MTVKKFLSVANMAPTVYETETCRGESVFLVSSRASLEDIGGERLRNACYNNTSLSGRRNQSESGEAKLRRKLFHAGYNPALRPVVNKSDEVTVKLGVSLHQIINVVRITQFLAIE